MKKATFITFLFAALMVALLVSCNTTPDPLPGETSSEITTAEITTEQDVTTEEAVTLDPNWVNDTTPASYRYLEGLPDEKWYFEWTPTDRQQRKIVGEIKSVSVDDSVVLKTPLRYEIQDDELNLILRFEFFEEEHPNYSFFQYRVTMINMSNEFVQLQHYIARDTRLETEDPSLYDNMIEIHDPNDYDELLSPDDSEHVHATGEIMSFLMEPGKTVISERCGPILDLGVNRTNYTDFQYFRYTIRPSGYEEKYPAGKSYYIPIEIVCAETEST
ncbi:MAG: hypothetical protein J6B77_08990 [Clostridia bacterium]|nr:hypothetical protein [Clostridia bacterium]